MTDPARIAAALSPAQRKALMEMGCAAVLVHGLKWPRGLFGASGFGEKRRLCFTPLGQQVRAHLAAAERGER